MIGDLGMPELLVILALVILLFGVGKVGRLGKDLGTAVREFRHAVRDDEPEGERLQAAAQGPAPQLPAGTPQLMERGQQGAQPPAPTRHDSSPPGIF